MVILGDAQIQRPVIGGFADKAVEPVSLNHRRPGSDYVLAPGRGRVMEFTYTANSFVAPDRVRFRYRLTGADQDWCEETSERTVRYINLNPGDYRFEVVSANHHRLWSASPAVFAFSLAPHFWQTWTFYGVCTGAVVGLAASVQAYRLRWQHRLLKLEQERAVASERARIARDLHDDLGTALTGLALELDVTGRKAVEGVSTVNPRCDTLSSLASFLEQQVSHFLDADDVRVHLDFPESIPEQPLPAVARHQLALGIREALTNVVRHAQATDVVVTLSLQPGELLVQVKDNGRGFRLGSTSGHGLENMRERLEQVGGRVELESNPGSGTTVTFRLPLLAGRSK